VTGTYLISSSLADQQISRIVSAAAAIRNSCYLFEPWLAHHRHLPVPPAGHSRRRPAGILGSL
jgi:hypothetical protein